MPELENKPEETQKEVPQVSSEAKELAELKAMIAKEKEEKKNFERKQAEEAKNKGELEKTIEIYRAQLAEFDQIKPMAENWQNHVKAESQRLEKEAEALPDSVKQLFARQQTLEDKREFLNAFRQTQTQSPEEKTKGKPPSFSPPQSDHVDFEAALRDSSGKLRDLAKQKDPEGWHKFIAKAITGGSKQMSSAERFRSR